MDMMPDGRPVIHLGDGAYAIYQPDGVWLHANHHLNPTDRIWLEGYALKVLNGFVEKCKNETRKTCNTTCEHDSKSAQNN